MYVRNVAGYNFAFKYRDGVIYVPSNGEIYSIPDDSGSYRELRVIRPMHIRSQKVTYINKDGSIASDNISGHKRRGRPPKAVDPKKPLKGVRVKRDTVPEPIPEPKQELPVDPDSAVVDIDLDELTAPVEKKEETKAPVKKTPAKKTTTGKKRGRPKKNP